jgi:hypothetical protein
VTRWLLPLVIPLFCAAQSVSMEGGAFRVSGWQPGPEPAAGWSSIFSVSAGPAGVPPLLGIYTIEQSVLTFRPRYPLAPGLRVRAVILSKEFEFETEKAAASPKTTRVAQIYPSTDVLPENQLKLYICFTAPMQSGDAWGHLRLLDSAGAAVELPFLEIDEELWNPGYTRLTVLFDPGRIKRGVLPLQEIGPSIRAGETYTLVIDRGWRDGRGAPLAEPYRKQFRVAPPDREPVDPAKWRIASPRAGTTEPLIASFDEPLDYAMLQHALTVAGVTGKVELERGETEWRFTPTLPWNDIEYQLVVQADLEDLAGNRVGRAFDVDVSKPVTQKLPGKSVTLSFRPRSR